MAHYTRDVDSFSATGIAKITFTELVENFTVYVIEMNLGPYRWKVQHRYSEFFDLNEKLTNECGLDKTLLPPKKLFGNQTEAFIRKRQQELELYLRTVLQQLPKIPPCLASFLHFNKYEIHGITQALAEELFHKGDQIVQDNRTFVLSPLQLHAVTRRLRLPEPTCDCGDAKKDIGHILDVFTRLNALRIVGSHKPVEDSNLICNQLNFDLSMFKALESLQLYRCSCELISGTDHLKKTLKHLDVVDTVTSIKDVLLLGIGHGQWMGGSEESLIVPAWSSLTTADFSNNEIRTIDESVKLLPRLSHLDLSHNLLEELHQLQHLSCLTQLHLTHNAIRQLHSLHTKLGNITFLNLSHNSIGSLQGFSKLYSLEWLNISHNEISQVLEVRHICRLPCLEKLNLEGNPVTIVVDYRNKIFELFGDRAKELSLDGEPASQKELDTVAILLALHKSKAMETNDSNKKTYSKKTASEARIDDFATPRTSSAVGGRDAGPLSQEGTLQGGWSRLPPEGASQVFRRQVEAIREQGGSTWLTSLNQMHSPLLHKRKKLKGSRKHKSSPAKPANKHDEAPSADVVHNLDVVRLQRNNVTLDSASVTSESSGEFYSESLGFMLPDTLPGRSDTAFTAQLQSLVPNVISLTGRSGVAEGSRRREERTQHIMWCCAICYTDPGLQIPACVYTTTENLHLFQVHSLQGRGGNPDLEHLYTIPLVNIQQIIQSYQELYLRIEEAFTGPQGTYALLTYSAQKSEDFMQALKAAICRAIPDSEHYEEPHIMVNGETELALKAVLNQVEELASLSSVPIRLYMLVQAPVQRVEGVLYQTCTLVLTQRHLYMVQEDYVLWPQPTFGIGPSSRPRFMILHHYPVGGRIIGIQMYDSDTLSGNIQGLPENFTAMRASASISSNFIGFGVKLEFETTYQTTKEFDIRVPTSGMRDRFLATLTQVRRELSERSPGVRRRMRKQKAADVKSQSQEISSTSMSNMSDSSSSQSFVSIESEKEVSSTTASEAMPTVDFTAGGCVPAGGAEAVFPVTPSLPYPSMQLLVQLTQCNENMTLLKQLSEPLANLALMTGEELLNLFHSSIAQISMGGEELYYVLWTMVTPYVNPHQEITTCLFLSNKALYFVSDDNPTYPGKLPKRKTHHRNNSDSLLPHKFQPQLPHHTSGIIHTTPPSTRPHLHSYYILPLDELQAVHIGMFDQFFRFSGSDANHVYSCITRDTRMSEHFIKELMVVLSTLTSSPAPRYDTPDAELDFYGTFNKYSRCESLAFMHASKVTFVYPSQDSVTELEYLLKSDVRNSAQYLESPNILFFLLLFHVNLQEGSSDADFYNGKPRSMVVTASHVTLLIQDYVSYPLPDFAVGLPDTPNYEIVCMRSLESLKRIVVSDFMSHDLTLVFEEEPELVVDANLEYYTQDDEGANQKKPPEVLWTLIIQNLRDRDRLLKLLQQQWGEINEGKDLSVQVSA